MRPSTFYWKLDKKLTPFKHFLMSWEDPVCWIIDKSGETILDVACGQGLPMQLIKKRTKFKKIVGVDLFEPYLEECKRKGIHREYFLCDVREMPFKDKSFDVVLASHILEHLEKSDAWKLLKRLERIAKKQVIIATPIGKTYHPAVDDNVLQLHLSGFYPEEFEKRGYKTIKFGRKAILGEEGLAHKAGPDLLKKLTYLFNILVSPFYYLFPAICDYYFVAFKNLRNDEKT